MKSELFELDYWKLWEKKYLTSGVPGQPDVTTHNEKDRADFNRAMGIANKIIYESLTDPTTEYRLDLGGTTPNAILYLETENIEEFDIALIVEKIRPYFRKWMKN